MRISIKFEPEAGVLRLPIHYNHLVQSMIYRSLDKALATRLHEKGYEYGKRRFKLFTFSRLLSYEVRLDGLEKKITLKPPISLKISAMDTDILESLAYHLLKNPEVNLAGEVLRFTAVEVEPTPKLSAPVFVRAISPITVYKTLSDREGRKKTYYFNPREREFSELILDNLERKRVAFYGRGRAPTFLDDAYIEPVNVSKRNAVIVKFKGIWIKGWTGIYEMNLPEPYFTLAYNSGLGSKNSQGFGMVEVVKGKDG